MVKREVRFSRVTDTGEQIRLRHRYTIAIINDSRDVKRIREKFLEYLHPTADVIDICDWIIPHSRGIRCSVFSFSSDVGFIDEPERIYNGDFKWDRDLVDGSEEFLFPYLRRRGWMS